MKDSEHKWTDGDNLIAYHLYRFGDNSLSSSKPELAEIMGMSLASLNYKIGNFKAIDGKGGFEGYSRQAVRIYDHYHIMTDADVIEATNTAVVQAMEARLKSLQDELARRRQ